MESSSRSRRSPEHTSGGQRLIIQDSPEFSVILESSHSNNPEVEDVLEEIAEEEINEVDIIMEDISDEIKDLQVSLQMYFPFFPTFSMPT